MVNNPVFPQCSGQLKLATLPDCSRNSRSDSFGVNPLKKIFGNLAELQADLDKWLDE